jgi:hydroxymethylglutaryl-CoA lyase
MIQRGLIMIFPDAVKIVEVGPRDGLQNESQIIPTAIKIDFINRLSETGLSVIEATSFVSPKWIPQLADHSEVFQSIKKNSAVSYPVLVPNIEGMMDALESGVKEIAVFTAPSEAFCQKNIHCSVRESLAKIAEVLTLAKKHHVRVRGYLSCVLGCPYEGAISPVAVTDIADKLIRLGCYEISLGDTIGVGTPTSTQTLLATLLKKLPADQLAVHFHDTYGQALVNIYVALSQGINVVDSSVSGLGGCPYAKGATGNVATEDVVYLLQGMNIKTGIDLNKLIKTGRFIMQQLNKPSKSRVNLASL